MFAADTSGKNFLWNGKNYMDIPKTPIRNA